MQSEKLRLWPPSPGFWVVHSPFGGLLMARSSKLQKHRFFWGESGGTGSAAAWALGPPLSIQPWSWDVEGWNVETNQGLFNHQFLFRHSKVPKWNWIRIKLKSKSVPGWHYQFRTQKRTPGPSRAWNHPLRPRLLVEAATLWHPRTSTDIREFTPWNCLLSQFLGIVWSNICGYWGLVWSFE